jgi:hypothetical protein
MIAIISAITAGLTILQLFDLSFSLTGLIIGKRKRKALIYFSFFVWHLSLVFFSIEFLIGTGEYWWIPIIQIINSAFSLNDLGNVKVVKIVNVEDSEKELDEIISILGGEKKGKVLRFTFQESSYFGLKKELKIADLNTYEEDGDYEKVKKYLKGHEFDIIS